MNYQSLRKKCAFYLDDSQTVTGKSSELLFLGMNLIACFLFIYSASFGSLPYMAELLENAVVAFFLLEYILRLWSAPKRISYLFSAYGLIDLVSILPSFISAQNLYFLRGLKVLRILKFLRFLETEIFFFGKVSQFKLQIFRTLFTVLTILFVSAGFIHSAESMSQTSQIKSFEQAFYFCVITLSTVGYGDLVPITMWGRWFTILMIFLGAIFVPWQVGKLVRLLLREESGKKNAICSQCGLDGHDPDASHCKACGHVIFQIYEGVG